MPRPTLLIIDPDVERRNALSQSLTGEGYEVVPTVDARQGLRFAASLEGAVLVAAADLPEVSDGSLMNAAGAGQTLVLLGVPESDAALSEDVSFIPTGVGLAVDDVCRKLHLVLVGRELGVDADSRCEALVGDLSLLPLPELLGGLGEARLSARLELERGTIELRSGEVVAAYEAPVEGRKAFCRLSRLSSGPFRLVPGDGEVERQIHDDVSSLIVAAIEDAMGEFPDPRTRVRIEIGPDFFARELSAVQQRIVQVAQKGSSLQAVLDSSPETDGKVMDDLLRLAERGIAVLEEPAPAVRVVTDSTADLPAHVARELGIHVVPLKVRFDKNLFRDGVELEARRFYELLEAGGTHPSTEPPDVGELLAGYRDILEQGDVVSLHISSKLSATYEHASEAAKQALTGVARSPAYLEVIDTKVVSVALGYLAIFAARLAARGESATAIRQRLRTIAPRLHILFVVDTLDYLVRGGRIGRARGLLGKILDIKPILGLVGGEVSAVERVRGGRAAQTRLIELMSERLDKGRPTVAAFVHAKAPARADRVSRLFRSHFEVSEQMIAEMGPVVGTHVGPGTVGVMGFQPQGEEAELLAPLGPS